MRTSRTTAHGRRPSLNGLAVQVSAFALSFMLVALLVVGSSRAAFVDQNENVRNEVTAAEVDLSDSAAGTALFSDGQGLAPGVASDRCIEVTYDGNVDPGPVRLYAASVTGPLAAYLQLTVEMGPAGAGGPGSCAGFAPEATLFSGTLAGFAAAHPGYEAGRSAWDPAGPGEARRFRFSVTVPDDEAAEGLSTSFGFTWETRTG